MKKKMISKYIWEVNKKYFCFCPVCNEKIELSINDEENIQEEFYGYCEECKTDIDFFKANKHPSFVRGN